MQIDLKDYGYSDDHNDQPGMPARIIAQHRQRFQVVCPMGFIWAVLKTGVYGFEKAGGQPLPTVGDFVLLQYQPAGESLIIATLPRRSFFSRRDPSPRQVEQAVAANFDTVLVLCSLNQDFNPRRIERYVTATWQSGAVPVVVLTKKDLCQDCALQLAQAQQAAPGVPVFALSAKTGEGMEQLAPYLLPGKTLVLLGSSGVGKSSLVNALAGREVMQEGEIRQDDDRGRHTTTLRQLLRLDSGVLVIDTPGMRMLGMWDISKGLDKSFEDVAVLAQSCRFADCRHGAEPGCAVQAALQSGVLSPQRYESYLNLRREAKYADEKDAYLRRKQEKFKDIAKANRQREKSRGRRNTEEWGD